MLAAVIIDAVVFGMIDVAELRRLHRVTPFDFWIAGATIVGVLSVGVLAGVVVGVVLSVGWLVYVATRPPMLLLGRQPGTLVFRALDEHPDDETLDGIAVLRLEGGLFFATADALENRVRGLLDGIVGLEALVLDLDAVTFVDSQGSAKLIEIHELLSGGGVRLHLSAVKPQVRAILDADGVLDVLGVDQVHADVWAAVSSRASTFRVACAVMRPDEDGPCPTSKAPHILVQSKVQSRSCPRGSRRRRRLGAALARAHARKS